MSNGVLVLRGAPYRGVGVNYFSLYSRTLARATDSSSLTNLAVLAKSGIPFVRFMAGGFWPAEQNLYLTNKAVFFERLDQVVRVAETNGIGLIPSLFWNFSTVPDLVGESMQELGNPASRSIAHIRQYTMDVVERYRSSPAIWGWEFGNELNLAVDLPNASEHRPATGKHLGAPTSRSARDELRSTDMITAFETFSRAVRERDPTRAIFTGNAIPRPHAWHNSKERSWKADSAAQFEQVLLRDNLDPIDTITVHLYPAKTYPAPATNLAGIIQATCRIASKARKPLFIGEFGIPRSVGDLAEQSSQFEELLKVIEAEKVPLAAVWVYDYPPQDDDWNISLTKDRSFMIRRIAEVNRRLK